MRSVRTALSVFEAIARDQPVALTEIATDLALPVTTVHRALGTLAEAGWIRQVLPGRRWVVSDHLERVVGRRFAMLADRVRPVLADLRTRTGESTMYAVADGDHMVVVVAVDSAQALRVVGDEGSRHPLHRVSTGKAILATWTDTAVTAYAQRVGADPAELLDECAATRSAGYAVNIGGWQQGVGSISVAVGQSGEHSPTAGVGVFGPLDRFDGRVDSMAELVREAAQTLTDAHTTTTTSTTTTATNHAATHETTRGIA